MIQFTRMLENKQISRGTMEFVENVPFVLWEVNHVFIYETETTKGIVQ